MRIGKYFKYWHILDDSDQRNVVQVPKMQDWVDWAAKDPDHNYRVAYDEIGDDCNVSTIFIGFSFAEEGMLFETAVFQKDMPTEVYKSQTYNGALAQHAAQVAFVRAERAQRAGFI